MAKNYTKFCKNCNHSTRHNTKTMSGECLVCGYSDDDIEVLDEDEEDEDLDWKDDDFNERAAYNKTHKLVY